MKACEITAYTRCGPHRAQNEDACALGDILMFGEDINSGNVAITPSDCPFLVTLADGMGGHDDGEVASRTSVEYLSVLFGKSGTEFSIGQAIVNADHRVGELGRERGNSLAMGTTIVGVVIDYDGCTLFNVGDSRSYCVRDSTIRQVSEDDVSPGERSGLITQCLGGGIASPPTPHLEYLKTEPGDFLVLVSDGISDVLDETSIMNMVLKSTPDDARNLCAEAAGRGGGDDASAIICKIPS